MKAADRARVYLALTRMRGRMALLSWTRKHSGYDAHMELAHPPAGVITVGHLVFRIDTVTFSDGQMQLKATCDASQAGEMAGTAVLLGTDGQPVMRGLHPVEPMGTKTDGSTWQFHYALKLPDTEPAE